MKGHSKAAKMKSLQFPRDADLGADVRRGKQEQAQSVSDAAARNPFSFSLLDTILARITLVGALYLAAVALLPEFLMTGFRVAPIPVIGERLDAVLPQWFTQGLNVQFFFGGTSLLIVVGVAMDTVQQVESQLIMRHYDGFMKKARIRGRRG